MKNGLLLILAIALGVRLLGVASRQLWYDEAFSVLFAESGPRAMLSGTLVSDASGAAEEHPILYYLLLWGWIGLFGDAPAAVRALSVFFGILLVLFVFFLGRDMVGHDSGELMAALVALAPFQVHYSQEVRMYALMAIFIAAAAWALWRGMHRDRWVWWGIFAVLAALAMYTHSISAIYLVVLALTPILARRWRAVRAVLIAGLVAVGLYLPWMLQLPDQIAKLQAGYWMQRPGLDRLFSSLLSYVTNLPVPQGWLPLALFVSLFAVILAGWQTVQTWRSCDREDATKVKNLQVGLWLAYLAFAPLLLLFLVSQFQPVFVDRALLPAGAFFWMWVGWALKRTRLPRPIVVGTCVVLLAGIGLGLYQHLTYSGFPYAPYQQLGAWLSDRVAPGEVIVHSNKLSLLPTLYYERDLAQHFIADPPGSGSDTLAPSTQRVLGVNAEESIAGAVGDARGIWFMIFDQAVAEYLDAGLGDHPHLEWLEQRFQLDSMQPWGDLRVYYFLR